MKVLNLTVFRYFVTLADELHFGRAAERLHIVQPALSRAIKQLEDLLGVALMERSSRRVELTPAGIAFLMEAREVLQHAARAERLAKRAAEGGVLELQIAYEYGGMYHILPEAIKLFHKRYPNVDIQLQECSPADLATYLSEGRADLIIGHRACVAHVGFGTAPLYMSRIIAALPSEWPLACHGALYLRELENRPFISFPASVSPVIHAKLMSICHRSGLNPSVAQNARSMHAIMSLISSGIGYGLMNEGVRMITMPGVSYVEILDRLADDVHEYSIGWRPERLTEHSQNFIDVVEFVRDRREGNGARSRHAAITTSV